MSAQPEQMPELSALERYASAVRTKILTSQADLDPKDRIHPDMAQWCTEHGNIVAMTSGMILTSDPSSRDVQNCKTIMLNKGIRPGRVMAATPGLVSVLIDNIDMDAIEELRRAETEEEKVSNQQKRLRLLVQEAVNLGISDIHIEVREDVARIRFRKHGEMYLHAEWFPKVAREIASVAFNKETDHATAHFNPYVPQNASMPMMIDGVELRLRLASLPAHGGFDMVMRILGSTDSDVVPDLHELGYTDAQISIIARASKVPHGAILMAGPTGSGKTTTLASCMSMIEEDRKIYTIEDPVEKFISNATQVPVNTDKEDRGFASFGRASLRMDPDVIVLGEMRDEDTAGVMVRAAITGHLVYSTIHTNSATNIITRLADLGISPVLLGDGSLLVCLIYQRLVPTLCPHCKVPVSESQDHQPYLSRWQEYFGERFSGIYARGKDCEKCNNLGVTGRRVAAEVIWIDEQGREFIQKGDTFGWEKYLRNNGWQSHREHAIDLAAEGISDPLDVERVIGEINSAYAASSFNYAALSE